VTGRVWQIFAGLFVLAALSGLVAGRPAGALASGAEDSVWRDPAAPFHNETLRRDVVSVLAESKLFGAAYDDDLLAGDIASEAEAQDAAAPFPPIQSAALLDGEPVVYLVVDDRVIATVPGDTISGDWEIIAVSLKNVRAAQGGAEQVFPIFPAEPVDPG